MPIIQLDRLQAKNSFGYGVTIYESRLDPNIRYAIYVSPSGYGATTHLICAKSEIFKLKRNAIRLNKEASKVNDAPVLCTGVLEEVVQTTVGFLLKAKEIERYGVKIKRGIILDGPPGNGKTMLCRYIQKLCTQNDIEWSVVTASDIDAALADNSLLDLFTQSTVTFFDDIDVAYMDRTKGNAKAACSLLTAMDGMSEIGHLVRIFTTNEDVGSLDPAFTRPGRIDRCITLPKPTMELRKKLIQEYWPKEIQQEVDVEALLERSKNFSFAELEAIRTFLVSNKILGDKTWNLEKAFSEYHENRAEKKTGGIGLGMASKR
jgi:cell division protease FtsH